MIAQHLEGWDLDACDVLFIENVGNLVCPSSYDLGEDVRVALLSVTEGEDKPLKYPSIFNSADVASSRRSISPRRARPTSRCGQPAGHPPGIRVFETSARTGAGSTTGCLLVQRGAVACV